MLVLTDLAKGKNFEDLSLEDFSKYRYLLLVNYIFDDLSALDYIKLVLSTHNEIIALPPFFGDDKEKIRKWKDVLHYLKDDISNIDENKSFVLVVPTRSFIEKQSKVRILYRETEGSNLGSLTKVISDALHFIDKDKINAGYIFEMMLKSAGLLKFLEILLKFYGI